MAHYAFLDENNVVIEVFAGRNEDEAIDGISDWETYYGELRKLKCLRTSYTSLGGNRVNPQTGEIVAEGDHFRFNYAGRNFTYNETLDAFIPPKPNLGEWELDEATCLWVEVNS